MAAILACHRATGDVTVRWPWSRREKRDSGGDFSDAVVRLIEAAMPARESTPVGDSAPVTRILASAVQDRSAPYPHSWTDRSSTYLNQRPSGYEPE